MARRLMLDSMIFDKLDADPIRFARAQGLQGEGRLLLMITHVQVDELHAVPDAKRRERLQAVSRIATELPTRGAIVGSGGGRVGFDALGPPDLGSRYTDIIGPSGSHRRDAIIGAIAVDRVDGLVTEDGRLRTRVKALDTRIEVMSWAEFCAFLDKGPQVTGSSEKPL